MRYASAFKFLRPLIATWKFFDDPGGACQIEYCIVSLEQPQEKQWRALFTPLNRHFLHLFFNPQGNIRLLEVSAFERALAESQAYLECPEVFLETTSYQLCSEIIKNEIHARREAFAGALFRFRILVPGAHGANEANDEAFISGAHLL